MIFVILIAYSIFAHVAAGTEEKYEQYTWYQHAWEESGARTLIISIIMDSGVGEAMAKG